MTQWANSLIDAIDARILTLLADIRPYRAIVTDVDATGMVKLRKAEATTASTELYARVAGFVVSVDDEVVCLDIAGRAVVLGILQYAAQSGYAIDAALTVPDLIATGDVTLGDADGDVILTRGHNRHVGPDPSIAVGVALGSGGSVGATIDGTDEVGIINLTSGTTSLTTGVLTTITFATARPDTNYALEVTPRGTTAGVNAVQFYANRDSASAWSIRCNVAPGSGNSLAYHYRTKAWANPA